MSVDVLDRNERFVNGLALQASLVGPDGATRQVSLSQVAPGRYRAPIALPIAGSYAITLSGRDGTRPVGPRTFGLAVPYSSEYLDLGVDRDLLEEIARLTGGRMLPLANESLGAVTAPARQPASTRSQLWQPFLLAALLLLIAEVAVRKVTLPETWRQRWAQRRRSEPDEPEYEALRAAIARERARHLAALVGGERLDPNDPAVRARLYMAAGRRR